MTKARDIASASPAPSTVSATELGYLDGVTSAIQTQIDSKSATSHNHDATYLNQATIDAKGDLLVGTGNDAYARVAIGADGTVLTADSAQASGVSWAAGLPSQTGNSGKYLTTNGTTASWGTIAQPLNWTQRRNPANTNALNVIQYNGSNLYVAAGSTGILTTSPDGITWTDRTSGFGTDTIRSVGFGNGLWVAVGDTGKITTSTDGITWTARTANMGTNTIYDVKYANGVWVAVGAGGGTSNTGGITYSTDGITWTRKSQSLTVGPDYYSVVWTGSNWLVGGDLTTNNYVYATTPSGTWTPAVSIAGQSIARIWHDGTRVVFQHGNGTAAFSTNGNGTGATSYSNMTLQGNTGGSFRTFLYGTTMHGGGAILQTYSTVPINNFPSNFKNLGFAPTTSINQAGDVQNDFRAMFVGAAGILATNNNGIIHTSY